MDYRHQVWFLASILSVGSFAASIAGEGQSQHAENIQTVTASSVGKSGSEVATIPKKAAVLKPISPSDPAFEYVRPLGAANPSITYYHPVPNYVEPEKRGRRVSNRHVKRFTVSSWSADAAK